MYDLNELESNWRLYRRRKIKNAVIPTLAILSVVVLSVSAGFFIYTESKAPNKQQPIDTNTQSRIIAKAPELKEPEKPKLEQPEQKESKEKKQDDGQKGKNEPKTVILESIGEQKKVDEKRTQQKQQKIDIELKETKTLEVLEERYSKHKSADTAAMIAFEHYKNGDYQKAYKWAISANNLDAKNEKSWIVFAESANKLGKKEEAVSALENYIRSSQSDTAKNALSKIKNHE